MKKLIIVGLFSYLTACSEQPPTLGKLPDNAVILAFGDSLTYGTGATDQESYPRILSERVTLEVINEGLPGEISREGAERLPALLDQYRPDLMVLIHGGNDMLRKIPAAETVANINRMVAEARQRNIDIVMLGVPEPNLFWLKSADFYRTLAEIQHIPIDLETVPAVLSDSTLKSDPIHPNAHGYRLIAENIEKLLIQTGALMPH